MKIKQIYNVMFHKFVKEKKDCKLNFRKWNINSYKNKEKNSQPRKNIKLEKSWTGGVLYN